jgi:hypothetical protein
MIKEVPTQWASNTLREPPHSVYEYSSRTACRVLRGHKQNPRASTEEPTKFSAVDRVAHTHTHIQAELPVGGMRMKKAVKTRLHIDVICQGIGFK